jgi:hypothetical protein
LPGVTIAEIAVLVIATIGYLALRMYAERQVREGRTVWLWLPNGTYIVIGVVWLVLGLQLFATSPPVAVFLATLGFFMAGSRIGLVRRLRREMSAATTPEQLIDRTSQAVADHLVLWTCGIVIAALMLVVVVIALKLTGAL